LLFQVTNPPPPLKLNLNSKKRKKKKRGKRKKEKNKNQNMHYKSRLRMYVPFVYHENEYIHNVIGVAKRYFLNLNLKTEMLGDCFIYFTGNQVIDSCGAIGETSLI
jgi:hypothetical protein